MVVLLVVVLLVVVLLLSGVDVVILWLNLGTGGGAERTTSLLPASTLSLNLGTGGGGALNLGTGGGRIARHRVNAPCAPDEDAAPPAYAAACAEM